MTRVAATSLVKRNDKILAVWNKRYNCWTLPGGKVEPGESIEAAQTRELFEETGLLTVNRILLWSGPSAVNDGVNDFTVFVYFVEAAGEPKQMELECDVRWMTREELLAESTFAKTLAQVFAIERVVTVYSVNV